MIKETKHYVCRGNVYYDSFEVQICNVCKIVVFHINAFHSFLVYFIVVWCIIHHKTPENKKRARNNHIYFF